VEFEDKFGKLNKAPYCQFDDESNLQKCRMQGKAGCGPGPSQQVAVVHELLAGWLAS
jgi:hypothetical protein